MVVDSAVQEYDLRTGKLLRTWDALRHIPLSDSIATVPTNGFPWDAYHVNAIDLTGNGGFVVSMRNTWAAYRVGKGDAAVDLTPPWPRQPMLSLIREYAGVDVHPSMPAEKLERICDDLDVPHEPGWGPGMLVMEIYEKTVEPNLVGPMIVCDYPRDVSPLARTHRDDPYLVERFEVVMLRR